MPDTQETIPGLGRHGGRWSRRLDVSVTDRRWQHGCGRRHRPGSPCPPVGVWLVLAGCPHCVYVRGYYCSAHAQQSETR